MTTTQKVLFMTFGLFFVMTLIMYISSLLGYNIFFLTGDLVVPPWGLMIISLLLFLAQFILHASIILDTYDKSLLMICLPYVPIYYLVECFFPLSIVSSTIIPSLYILGIAIYKSYFKQGIVRMLLLYIIELLFQMIMLDVKTQVLQLGYAKVSPYQNLFFCVDIIIMLLVLYCIGGVSKHADNVKFSAFAEGSERIELDQQDLEAQKEFKSITGWRRICAVITLFGFQILQLMIIMAICLIGNVVWEGTIIIISFIFYGLIIHKRWHSKSVVVCTLVSAGLFYVAARAIPPFYYSQFIPVIMGLLITYVLYRVAAHMDEYNALKQKRPFSCRTATEEEIRERCIRLGKKDDYINFMILAYRSGKTRKEIAAELCISEATVKKYKHDRTIELEAGV